MVGSAILRFVIHALAYVAFILPFTAWLGWELKRKYSLQTCWPWIAGAVVSGLIGSLVYNEFFPDNFGNFLLHASGGVSATCLYVYFTSTLKLKFNWRLSLALLFAFTCMAGVLNELAEYFFETLGFGIFSYDAHDTWRDFVANTTGMVIAWALIRLFRSV